MKSDFLVIGSGISGLNFALNAAKYGKVIVITKKEIIESNTNYAQGGMAAVLSKNDSIRSHIDDTLKVGKGISNKKSVTELVKHAPAEIKKLVARGVEFETSNNRLCLTREGGHSAKRIVYAGDMTGKEVETTLVKNVRENKQIKVYENYIAIDFIMEDNACIGVTALDTKNNKIINFYSISTIIATGSIGQLYKVTTNPEIATGDGIAMAYRAGANLGDMEFVQFHPTTFLNKITPNFLISEATRGEGAILRNSKGIAFMKKYHKLENLAPRDIVTRAIIYEQKKGTVYIDMTHLKKEFLKKRFPTIYTNCKRFGIDISKDKIPVSPAAHYLCGGIITDLNAKTNLKGLFAIGECACTGVHGANRLASNSLVESLVFSYNALNAARVYMKNKKVITKKPIRYTISKDNIKTKYLKRKIRNLMWENVGIMRTQKNLLDALKEIDKIGLRSKEIKGINKDIIELKNITSIAKLITYAALVRKESRGTHYRTDFPKPDNKNWKKHILLNQKLLKTKHF